jgi:hypothetical protein
MLVIIQDDLLVSRFPPQLLDPVLQILVNTDSHTVLYYLFVQHNL